MKNAFMSIKSLLNELPFSLRLLIKKRILLGTLLILVSTICFFVLDYKMCIPLLLSGVVVFGMGVSIFFNCSKGKYIVFRGHCNNFEATALTNRVKSLYVYSPEYEKTVKFAPRGNDAKSLNIGDEVVVYFSTETPVLFDNNAYFINQYYAIEVSRKVDAEFKKK